MRRAAALACVATLAACGGGAKAPPEDTPLATAFAAGRNAIALDRPAEAATQFRAAYARALARDDAAALRDAGIDEAIAELDQDAAAASLATTARTRAALRLRGEGGGPSLDLVTAAALLRLGRAGEADAPSRAAEIAPDPEIAARGAFLRGLAAALRGDRAGLRSALARIDPPSPHATPTARADAAELRARASLADGRAQAALSACADAVRWRRVALDLRGLRRALAVEAAAARAAGDVARAASLDAQEAEAAKAATAGAPEAPPGAPTGAPGSDVKRSDPPDGQNALPL